MEAEQERRPVGIGSTTTSGRRTEGVDVVVVGAGIAGLTAAALLAQAGRRVLVVEREPEPGGWARPLESGGYRFDRAVHLIMGGNPDGPFGPGVVHSVLEAIGAAERCELFPVQPFYTAHFPGRSFAVPAGGDAFVAAHAEQFPGNEEALAELTQRCAELFRQYLSWPIRPRPLDWPMAPLRHPRLVRHLRSTADGAVRRFLADPELRTAYFALCPGYLGLPPSRASFLSWALMMTSYVEEGAFYCRGGFARLVDAFVDALRDHGGELELGHAVTEILTEGRRVAGVRLDDGRTVRCDRVVSAIDARETFGTLLDRSLLPARWMRKVGSGELSITAYCLYLGTDLPISAATTSMETIVHPTWNLEDGFLDDRSGREPDVSVTIPTLLDPSLAPDGCHQVVVAGTCYESQHDLDEVAASYVRAGATVVPGLDEHIVHAAGAAHGPDGPNRLPLHRLGPMYGWLASPAQTGPTRLPQTTPVKGLVLAGHWTQPGHGIWTVVASGVGAARLVLDRDPATGLQPLGW